MAFGVNKITGRPGPAPKPPRDGDRKQARQRVNVEVRTGRRPRPDESGSHRIVSALRAIEAWIREGGAL